MGEWAFRRPPITFPSMSADTVRILITGGHGLLGTALAEEARRRGLEPVVLGHRDLDVTDADGTRRVLEAHRPTTVFHCAAFTAVDEAEAHADEVLAVNRDGAHHVAEAAAAIGALVVYPSTDFVFDGRTRRPYRPDDPPAPRGAYARSKLQGEEAVRGTLPADRCLVVRTSWLYGAGGRNFVDSILEKVRAEAGASSGPPTLPVVTDQVGSPTWTGSLAPTLLDLAEGGARGVFHASDRGETSRLGLAGAALQLAGLEAALEPVSSDSWGAPAPRPPYSVLDVSATEEALGRALPHWTASLASYLGGRR